MVDKLILTGGQNVDPVFTEKKKILVTMIFIWRVICLNLLLLKKPLNRKSQFFSVCRGTQLMNIALGGTLNQDIEHHWQDKPSDYLSQNMLIKADTALEKIYGTSTSINSFHHQSIKRLADDLEVIAYDPADDTIEAVMSTNPAITFLGVQWHPEFLLESREEDRKLFKYVVKEL